MSVYSPLREWLIAAATTPILCTFEQIEEIIGRRLPNSSRAYASWWTNQNSGHHVQCRAWIDAGYHTAKVDIVRETVEFVRIKAP